MQNRSFGKSAWRTSALGFGAMRLPVVGSDPGLIDEPEATRMLRWAIDHGVNYIDTAWTYHKGASEKFLGRALQDGYRDRVRVATKLPSWLVVKADDFDRYLDEQLDRLQMDHVDLYLLHGLIEERWENLTKLKVFEWAERAMANGRFGCLGFSFHNPYEVFQKIVDGYDNWTMCQIQYNYMDEEFQAGKQGLKYAASKGLAVVVMEPIRGGSLARLPQSVQSIWDRASRQRTPVEWALQWVWSHPEVSVALSGMSTMAQVEENVALASRPDIGLLTDEEMDLIAAVRDRFRALAPIPCTGCEYCQPCESGVNIPRVFELYNQGIMFNAQEDSQWRYPEQVKETQRANNCTECGACEELCPQQINIRDWLKTAHKYLGG